MLRDNMVGISFGVYSVNSRLPSFSAPPMPVQYAHGIINTKQTCYVRIGSQLEAKTHPIAQKPSTYTSTSTFGNPWRATTARHPACQASARPRPANARRAIFAPPGIPSMGAAVGYGGMGHQKIYRDSGTRGGFNSHGISYDYSCQ